MQAGFERARRETLGPRIASGCSIRSARSRKIFAADIDSLHNKLGTPMEVEAIYFSPGTALFPGQRHQPPLSMGGIDQRNLRSTKRRLSLPSEAAQDKKLEAVTALVTKVTGRETTVV